MPVKTVDVVASNVRDMLNRNRLKAASICEQYLAAMSLLINMRPRKTLAI